MSEAQGARPQYADWRSAALAGNLASHAWANRPDMEQLVPGFDRGGNPILKGLDYASVPARVLTNALLEPVKAGGDAFARWMGGDQGPEARRAISEATVGMALNGLAVSNPLRVRPNELLAMPGFHGTPHTFAKEPGAPLGSFRNDKIGTGEGAQVRGWGHYIAEREGVARSYQEQLVQRFPQKYAHPDQVVPDSVHDILQGFRADYPKTSVSELVHYAKEWHQRNIDMRRAEGTVTRDGEEIFDPKLIGETSYRRIQQSEADLAWLNRFGNRLEQQGTPEGNLYSVEINPEKHQLIDLDKPFSAHPPALQRDIERAIANISGHNRVDPDMTGEQIYLALVKHTGSPQAASLALHEQGIPGMQFLDQLSRRMPEPIITKLSPGADGKIYWEANLDGGGLPADMSKYGIFNSEREARIWAKQNAPRRTHNFVIFHPSNLRITGANGQMLDYVPVDQNPWSPKP